MIDSVAGGPFVSDAKITFFVTANLLEHHGRQIEKLHALGHVLGAHGLYHSNMQLETLESQSAILGESRKVFAKRGLAVDGFRCPYLSYNEETIAALRSSPFWWTSQNLILWRDEIPGSRNESRILKRLAHIYSWTEADESISLPRMIKGLVEIPITAPDDEMLVERYKVRSPWEIFSIWERILHRVHERGELCHLLFHPERYGYVDSALRQIVSAAKKKSPPVWICSLAEIAGWWRSRRNARWAIEKGDGSRWLLRIEVPDGAILLSGPNHPGSAAGGEAHGGESAFGRGVAPVEPLERMGNAAVFPAGNGRRQTIGVSRGCPTKLLDFLAEEGFFVEQTDQADAHSVYIDRTRPFCESEKLPLLKQLEDASHPLLRFWRWPNGARSALAISSDVDAISIFDFVRRALHF